MKKEIEEVSKCSLKVSDSIGKFGMESPPSSPTALVVSSPRRTLSLLRERRAKPTTSHDPDAKAAFPSTTGAGASAAGLAHEHGPKSSEVYGFVGSITTVIATAIFLIWAYTPEPWLHSLGITYYPSKYWAIAIPSLAMAAIVLALTFYLGLNFMATPPPTSFSIMFDEYSRERSISSSSVGEDQQIEPISDIAIDKINNLMFG